MATKKKPEVKKGRTAKYASKTVPAKPDRLQRQAKKVGRELNTLVEMIDRDPSTAGEGVRKVKELLDSLNTKINKGK